MSEINWSKAPEGATHAGINAKGSVGYFYRLPGVLGDYDYWNATLDDAEWSSGKGNPVLSKLITRPSPAWSCGGIPPVGSLCEVRQKTPCESSFDWEECRIALINTGADGKPQVCTLDKRGDLAIYYPQTDIVEFRPIRTPEQIAADERHEAVMRMSDIVGDIEKVPSWTDALEALYDAGLRFSEQPK
jgi:hypothetical protein